MTCLVFTWFVASYHHRHHVHKYIIYYIYIYIYIYIIYTISCLVFVGSQCIIIRQRRKIIDSVFTILFLLPCALALVQSMSNKGLDLVLNRGNETKKQRTNSPLSFHLMAFIMITLHIHKEEKKHLWCAAARQQLFLFWLPVSYCVCHG